MSDPITITYQEEWRRPIWVPELFSRPAWFVSCSEHPHLGKDHDGEPWGYAKASIARSVATRHRRAKHNVKLAH